MAKKKRTLKYIDLFAGCGGLSIGFERAGFKLELAVEKSAMAAETFYHNFIKAIQDKNEWNNFCALPLSEQAEQGLVVNTIREVLDNKEVMKKLRSQKIDMVVGGPPCQGFSMAGRRNPKDARNELPWQFIEFIEQVSPKAVIMENVVGISRDFGKHDIKAPFMQLYMQLQKTGRGYDVQPVELNAMHFGVPQHRPRMMLLGIRKDISKKLKLDFTSQIYKSIYDFEMPKKFAVRPQIVPKAEFFGEKILTAQHALWDIADTDYKTKVADQKYNTETGHLAKQLRTTALWYLAGAAKEKVSTKLSNQIPRNHNEDVKFRFRLYQLLKQNKINHKLLNMISADSLSDDERIDLLRGNLGDIKFPLLSLDKVILAKDMEELLLAMLRLATKKHSQRPIDLNKPAPTMVTLPDDFVHPFRPRILTVREMARIQSFPDAFEFRGKETTGGTKRRTEVPQYTQVGNAVAPVLAYKLAKRFVTLLDRIPD